jgi:hypothetical protein
MTTPTREAIYSALFALVSGAYAWKTSARRLKLWGDVPPSMRPALFQFEGVEDDDEWTGSGGLQLVRTLACKLFIYTDASDPSTIGATQLNNINDALDAALAPSGGDVMTNRQTLGGLVSSCRIKGRRFKDPGDLDGDGLLIVPISIVWP